MFHAKKQKLHVVGDILNQAMRYCSNKIEVGMSSIWDTLLGILLLHGLQISMSLVFIANKKCYETISAFL